MARLVVTGILVITLVGLVLFSAGVTDTWGLGFSITRGETSCVER